MKAKQLHKDQSIKLLNVDPKQWAKSLKSREEAGEQLTRAQREMWRSALRVEMMNE